MKGTARKPKNTCPVHRVALVGAKTQYGRRYACPTAGCTVVRWDGSTSTPADAETRELRRQCHALFDPLWQSGANSPFNGEPGGRSARRGRAYVWLAHELGTVGRSTHFGYFTAEQCRRALTAIQRLIDGRQAAQSSESGSP